MILKQSHSSTDFSSSPSILPLSLPIPPEKTSSFLLSHLSNAIFFCSSKIDSHKGIWLLLPSSSHPPELRRGGYKFEHACFLCSYDLRLFLWRWTHQKQFFEREEDKRGEIGGVKETIYRMIYGCFKKYTWSMPFDRETESAKGHILHEISLPK